MPKKLTHEEAAKVMIENGLTPLETYPGTGLPWRCRHEECGNVVTPRRAGVLKGQGVCRHCRDTETSESNRMFHDEAAFSTIENGVIVNDYINDIQEILNAARSSKQRESGHAIDERTVNNSQLAVTVNRLDADNIAIGKGLEVLSERIDMLERKLAALENPDADNIAIGENLEAHSERIDTLERTLTALENPDADLVEWTETPDYESPTKPHP